jgi:hypothetical protein
MSVQSHSHASFYIGLESLALSAEDTKDPRTALPKGMIASAVLTMVFGIITPLVGVTSQPSCVPCSEDISTLPPHPNLRLAHLLFRNDLHGGADIRSEWYRLSFRLPAV